MFESKLCPDCRKQVEGHLDFCPNCGSDGLMEGVEARHGDGHGHCHDCGRELDGDGGDDWQYCGYCGEDLDTVYYKEEKLIGEDIGDGCTFYKGEVNEEEEDYEEDD